MEIVMYTETIKRTPAPRLLSMLLAASILANVVLATAALAATGHLPFAGNDTATVSLTAPTVVRPAATGKEQSLSRSTAAGHELSLNRVTAAPAMPHGDPGHESSFEKWSH
jgi:hypothetical protein